MEELIKELMAKANLSEDQARQSAAVMKEFVKTKLPPLFQDKIDDILDGKLDLGSILGGLNPMDMFKGMFGGKK